jgi:hypothetical protein
MQPCSLFALAAALGPALQGTWHREQPPPCQAAHTARRHTRQVHAAAGVASKGAAAAAMPHQGVPSGFSPFTGSCCGSKKTASPKSMALMGAASSSDRNRNCEEGRRRAAEGRTD